MPRTLVGLLAAVGAIASGLAAYAHGDLVWIVVAGTAAAAGLVTFATAPSKKISLMTR
jgi:hypothetical protein